MKISVIIPALNEEENLGKLLKRLKIQPGKSIHEIIVVDGGSTDETCKVAEQYKVMILKSPEKGRSVQMNYGAKQASGDILYFLHSDTLPPDTFLADIKNALDEGFPVGCFRYQFNSPRKLLKVNAYFTRFDKIWCRGGDQSLYIRRTLFEEMNGFREDYQIMEDFDFIIWVRKSILLKSFPAICSFQPESTIPIVT